MRQETINIYTFDELSNEAKERAISDHINFEIEVAGKDSYIYPAIEEADRLQTPWFTASIVYEMFKDSIIDTIKINRYEFTADGKIY